MSFVGDGTYVGLSGERPTAGIGSGTRFLDRGTGAESYWNGSIWQETPRNIFSGASITGIISGSHTVYGITTFSGNIDLRSGTVSGSPTFAGNISVSGSLTATVDIDVATVKNVVDYDSIIYSPVSGTYASRKRDGTLLRSGNGSAHLQGVVQDALDNGGRIAWAKTSGGNYVFANAMSGGGVYIPNGVHLSIHEDAIISPANDFSGTLFRIDDFTSGAHVAERIRVEGGRFQEGGATPSADWTLFRFESASSTIGEAGVVNVTLRNIYVKRCRTMIEFIAISGTRSYINGNNFDTLWCDYPKQGITFSMAGSGESSLKTISRNVFNNVVIQADPSVTSGSLVMTYGIMDIGGKNNAFINCKMWDTISGQITTSVSNQAADTIFIGGIITAQPYHWGVTCNFGTRTHVYGDSHTVYENHGITNPFIKCAGTFMGGGGAASTGAVGDGLLNGVGPLAVSGAAISTPSPTADGTFKRMSTGSATSGAVVAIRSASIHSNRNVNPYLEMKVKLNQLSGCTYFAGFASSTTVGVHTSGDAILSGIHGFGIGWSASGSATRANWQVYRNDAGAGTTVIDTGVPVDTNANKFILAGYEEGPSFHWRINSVSGQVGMVTTEIPPQFTGMIVGNWLGNMELSGADKTADSFKWFLNQNEV